MILYGCPNSRSLRAAWALEETGAPYDYAHVDLFKGEGRQPDFLAINPAGKLPVLVDGALTLTESAAIVTYLGERFPDSGLVPAGAAARADYFRWCSFAITELEPPIWAIAKHRFILPKDKRVAGVEATARWEFADAARQLAAHLAGRDFLLNGGFSGADILAGHTLAWAKSAKVPLDPPVLETYLQRLNARPALDRARARETAA
ncbi:MAG: glutathione S-transferase family protein [Burkholderiales bacterium]